jgi:ubiquitin-protein ligase
MSSQKFIARELKQLAEADPKPLYSIAAPPEEEWKDDFAGFTVTLRGPPDSPYKNGCFVFDLAFNQRYPFVPPTLTLRTPIVHPAFECPEQAAAEVDESIESYSPGNTFGHNVTVHTLAGEPLVVSKCKTLGALYTAIQDKKGVSLDEVALVVDYADDASQEMMKASLSKYTGRRLPPYGNEVARELSLEELGFRSSSLMLTMILGSGGPFEGKGLAGGESCGGFWSPGMSVAMVLDAYVQALRDPTAAPPAWMAFAPETPPSHQSVAVLAGLKPQQVRWLASTYAEKLAQNPDGEAAAIDKIVANAEASLVSSGSAADQPAVSKAGSGCCNVL